MDQFTICGRFKSPFLPEILKNMTIQTPIYCGKMWFLNSIEMRDCELDRYKGCTNYYKHKIGNIHIHK